MGYSASPTRKRSKTNAAGQLYFGQSSENESIELYGEDKDDTMLNTMMPMDYGQEVEPDRKGEVPNGTLAKDGSIHPTQTGSLVILSSHKSSDPIALTEPTEEAKAHAPANNPVASTEPVKAHAPADNTVVSTEPIGKAEVDTPEVTAPFIGPIEEAEVHAQPSTLQEKNDPPDTIKLNDVIDLTQESKSEGQVAQDSNHGKALEW